MKYPDNSKCSFCDEINNGVDNDFYRMYYPQLNCRQIFVNSKFLVMPSIGQIVEGYVLILTKRHKLSLGNLSLTDIIELENLKNSLRAFHNKCYNRNTIFFEHGMSNTEQGGCGIYHAHMHALPLNVDSDFLVKIKELESTITFQKVNSFLETREILAKNKSYLSYEDNCKRKYLAECDKVPSQLFRKVVSEYSNSNVWKWQDFEHEEKLVNTYFSLKTQLFET